MWFEFSQNNSGGNFDVNDNVTHRVYIEANSVEEANEIAETKGIYFNGCNIGSDCPCCGDRWYESSGPIDEEFIYGAFKESEANQIAKDYNGVTIDTKYPHYARKVGEPYKDVRFSTIRDHAQYLADKYGWCTPDAYIYHLDGNKEYIYSKKVSK